MKMERLSTIQKNGRLNDIYAIGDIGPGGAKHEYAIVTQQDQCVCRIHFQKGPREDETSVEGACDQDLLEIVRDRLRGFVNGDMPTRETAIALTHVEEALLWLNKRIEDRIERGVLGTMEK